MSKRMIVLGTSHQLQGAKFLKAVDDPSYRDLVEQTTGGQNVDFVFEEASGYGPTHAEEIALSMIGPNRYLDIDPPRAERGDHGLSAETGATIPIDLWVSPPDVARWEYCDRQEAREQFWLQKIKGREFECALIICGAAHTLSFSFRLKKEGFDVKSLYYEPYHKLCTRPHISA